MNILQGTIAWLIVGYILFLVTVKLDSDAENLIQKHEKKMVLLIILWPLLVVGLLRWIYRQGVKQV